MATAAKQPAVKDPVSNSVRVEIFDQAYNLRGTDADYILQLAEYVDAKMRAVAAQTQTVDTARVAVLAALNIADEYQMLQRKLEGGNSDYLERAHHLADALDEVLQDKRRAGDEPSLPENLPKLPRPQLTKVAGKSSANYLR